MTPSASLLCILALAPHAAFALAGFGKAPSKAPAKKAVKSGSFDGKKTFEKQMRSWNAMHDDGQQPDACDVYVRSERSEKFWFVGKSAGPRGACDDAAACSAVVQKRLVLEHAKLLQLELRMAPALELWCAPLNSEMRVAQKQQGLRRLDGLSGARDALSMDACGFLPEQNVKDNGEKETGFYVRLPPDGQPLEASEVKVVSPTEFEKLKESGVLAQPV